MIRIYMVPLLLYCLLVSHPVTVFAQATTSASEYDPLTANELDAALDAAFAAGAAAGAESVSAAAFLRQEVLLVERHQEPKATRQSGQTRRRSDAYIYDYTTNELKHVIVDLETQEVEVIEKYQGIQLPLTENEITNAYFLAFSQEEVRQQLNEQYRQITGGELTDAAQLEIKAFIFTVDAMPDEVNQFSEECGIHRCAQLQFYTTDNTILDIQPIVDLSRGIVIQDISGGIEFIEESEEIDPDMDTESGDDSEESADQITAPGQGMAVTNSRPSDDSNIFLPFVARRLLQKDDFQNKLILDQLLFLWWCDWMSQTQYKADVELICMPLEELQ